MGNRNGIETFDSESRQKDGLGDLVGEEEKKEEEKKDDDYKDGDGKDAAGQGKK